MKDLQNNKTGSQPGWYVWKYPWPEKKRSVVCILRSAASLGSLNDQNLVMDMYKPFKQWGSDKEGVTHYAKEQLQCVEVFCRMGSQ